ncbi:hypothetical protein LTR17_016890 [Elasticomyces elasticus]|nr:hypothetical protein LTR17_016890 [Elasticomyces elasticus]
MRLIDTNTLELVELAHPPEYAILSHRWTDEEVTHEEYTFAIQAQRTPAAVDARDHDRVLTITGKSGFQKIKECCKFARADHQNYIWIDSNNIYVVMVPASFKVLCAPLGYFVCRERHD